MKSIQLHFNSDMTSLEGWMYGYLVYMEQVSPYLKENEEFVEIIIPQHIQYISSSFLRGFCDKWMKYGSSHVLDYIHFNTENKQLKRIISNNIYG